MASIDYMQFFSSRMRSSNLGSMLKISLLFPAEAFSLREQQVGSRCPRAYKGGCMCRCRHSCYRAYICRLWQLPLPSVDTAMLLVHATKEPFNSLGSNMLITRLKVSCDGIPLGRWRNFSKAVRSWRCRSPSISFRPSAPQTTALKRYKQDGFKAVFLRPKDSGICH